MTRREMEGEDWGGEPAWEPQATVLVLDDGTKLYASRDSEGNGPGALFGVSPKGEHFILMETTEEV